MNDRAQNRPMANQQQQENRSEADEEPADPTSAAVPLDCALSIVAHEFGNLFPHLVIATGLLLAPAFRTGALQPGALTGHSARLFNDAGITAPRLQAPCLD